MRKTTCWLACLCWLLFTSSNAQTPNLDSIDHYARQATALIDSFELTDAIDVLHHTLDLYPNDYQSDSTYAALHHQMAKSHYYLGQIDSTIHYWSLTYQYAGIWSDSTSMPYANASNNLGIALDEKGDYRRAIVYYEKALNTYLRLRGPDDRKVGLAYTNIAVAYVNLSDYGRALDYFEEALRIDRLVYGEGSVEVGYDYINIAGCKNQLSNLDEALNDFKKALNILKQDSLKQELILRDLHGNIGIIYRKKGEIKLALEYFNIKNKIISSAKDFNTSEAATTIFDIALCQKELKNLKESENLFLKSLKLSEKAKNKILKLKILERIISLYLTQNKIVLTEKYIIEFQKTLHNLTEGDSARLKTDLFYYDISLTKNLITKYEVKYKKTKKIEHLEKALDLSLRGVEKLLDHRNRLYSNISKNKTTKDHFSIFDSGINAAFTLYQHKKSIDYKQSALIIAEKSKSLKLRETLNLKKVFIETIDKKLLKKQEQLNINIGYWVKQKLIYSEYEDSKMITKAQNKIFNLRKELFELQDSLKLLSNYYFQNTNVKAESISIKSIQKQLRPSQSIIEFYISNNSMFIFTINKKIFKFNKISNYEDIKSKSIEMSNLIRFFPISQAKGTIIEDNQQLSSHSSFVYNSIFKKIENDLRKETIIIPDDFIWQLPIDALMFDSLPKSKTRYFCEKHASSIGYSITTLINESPVYKPTKEGIFTLAPVFKSKEINNEEEVSFLRKRYLGHFNKNENITRSEILKNLKNYGIIHIATHAIADESNGNLSYFKLPTPKNLENKLFANELLGLNLNSDLVVLSACQTGAGELVKGNGIVGLTSAFRHAGAKSIISTLWEVNDKQNIKIIKKLYSNLEKDIAKNIALQNTKVEYLQESKSSEKHPYYWSSYVIFGDTSPLKIKKKSTNTLPFISIISISFLLYLIYKSKSTKKSFQ